MKTQTTPILIYPRLLPYYPKTNFIRSIVQISEFSKITPTQTTPILPHRHSHYHTDHSHSHSDKQTNHILIQTTPICIKTTPILIQTSPILIQTTPILTQTHWLIGWVKFWIFLAHWTDDIFWCKSLGFSSFVSVWFGVGQVQKTELSSHLKTLKLSVGGGAMFNLSWLH